MDERMGIYRRWGMGGDSNDVFSPTSRTNFEFIDVGEWAGCERCEIITQGPHITRQLPCHPLPFTREAQLPKRYLVKPSLIVKAEKRAPPSHLSLCKLQYIYLSKEFVSCNISLCKNVEFNIAPRWKYICWELNK